MYILIRQSFQLPSNSTPRSMAMEPAACVKVPCEDSGELFYAATKCEHSLIPDIWVSPLTSRWLYRGSATHLESHMLLLAGLTHRWLATFIDNDDRELTPNKKVLGERESLRLKIEHFAPVTGSSNVEV